MSVIRLGSESTDQQPPFKAGFPGHKFTSAAASNLMKVLAPPPSLGPAPLLYQLGSCPPPPPLSTRVLPTPPTSYQGPAPLPSLPGSCCLPPSPLYQGPAAPCPSRGVAWWGQGGACRPVCITAQIVRIGSGGGCQQGGCLMGHTRLAGLKKHSPMCGPTANMNTPHFYTYSHLILLNHDTQP